MSDLELISLSLTAEFMGIDSENNLFRLLPEAITNHISRSVYNRRRRKLTPYIDAIRLTLAEYFNEFEDYFVEAVICSAQGEDFQLRCKDKTINAELAKGEKSTLI